METNKDKLLKDFFSENRKEIDDFGFSQRVIRKLPIQTDSSWIIWLFAAVGFSLALLLGFQTGLIEYTFRIIQIIPPIFSLIGFGCFSVIGCIIALLQQNRIYRLI